MSTTVDNRVVQMQFDNKQFENNVATSMSTLDKLKKSLNLDGASKGLDGISKSAKKVDMSPIGNAAETVGLKFNAMYSIADQALRNITTSAMTYGKKIVSALAIDPLKTGFSEYETKIGSIQTIMSNTASKGTTMADVTRVIDELNTYADKTIYNFSEMTRNIGTFTAAGVGLEESAAAIQGIANLAAASGSNSQQASTAMYQLSQALSSGTVKLQDWNSVVNAGMGGQKFQDALKATARDHGVAVDDMIKKNGSFRESLSEGWITADILNETLNKFTVEGAKSYSESMMASGKWTQEQADALVKEAQAMEDAATKVKTFTQLVDTMKESLQSGWGKTWELIVGDFDQAKELWTGISDALGGMIEKSADARNNMLEGALSSNWQKLVKEINAAGVETADFEDKVREVAKSQGKDLDALVEQYGSLEKVFQKGALSSDVLDQALGKIGKSMVDLSGVTKTLKEGMSGDDVKQVEKALKTLGYNMVGKDGKDYSGDGYFGTVTRDALKEFQKAQGLEVTGIVDEKTIAALREATTETTEFSDKVKGLVDNIEELGGRQKLIASFKSLFTSFKYIVAPIGKAFREIFPRTTSEQLMNLINGFQKLTRSFKLFLYTAKGQKMIRNLTSMFKGLFSAIDIGIDFIVNLGKGIFDLFANFGGLADSILGVGASFGDWITNMRNSIKENDTFGKSIGKMTSFLQNGIDKVKRFFGSLKEKIKMPAFEGFLGLMQGIWNIIAKVGGKVAEVSKSIGESLMGALSSDNLMTGLDVVNSGLFTGILVGVTKFVNGLSDTFDGAGGFLEGITSTLDGVKGCLEAWQTSVKADAIFKIATALAILAGSLWLIASIDSGKLSGALASIGVLFAELVGSLSIFSSLNINTKGMLKSAGAMVGMATAVLILSAAVKNLSSLSWEGIGKGLAGVGVLLAELALFMNNAKFSGKSISTAIGMVILASALKILASVCKDFGGMEWGDIGKGLASIGALLLMLGLFTKITGNAKHVTSTGVALVLIGASMKIFASACKDFANMSWEELGRGMAGLAGALVAVAIATKLMPKNMFGIGLGLLVVGGALHIMSNVLKKMGSLTWDEIGHGLAALGGSMVVLALGLRAMTGAMGGSVALLLASAALAILAPVLAKFGNMSWETIGKGLLAMAGALAVLGIAAAVLGPIVPTILKLAGAFALAGVGMLAFGVGLAAIAVAFGVLATMAATGATAVVSALTIIVTGIAALLPTIFTELGKGIVAFCEAIGNGATAIGEAIKAVVLAIVDVLVECIPSVVDGVLQLLVGIMDGLVTYGPQIVDKLISFFITVFDGVAARAPELMQSIVNMITSIFASIGAAFAGINMDVFGKAALGFGAVAILAKIISAIGPSIPGAIVGLVGIGILVAELTLLLAAIGALAQVPGLKWLINEGGDLLQAVGTALGQLVGGLIGGVAQGVTAALPQIATDLSTFATNLQPFIDTMGSLDATAMSGIDSLTGAIIKLTAAELLDGMASWIGGGGTSMADFATQIGTLGESMVAFSGSISSLSEEDVSKVDSVAAVTESLVTLANKIPKEGGWADAIVGATDIAGFAEGITSLGPGIVAFAASVSSLTEEDTAKIESVGGAVTSLATLAKKIPKDGGWADAILGATDIAGFANGIVTLGPAITTFLSSISTVTDDDMTKIGSIATAVGSIVTLANNIPKEGGWADKILGAKDLGSFAGELTTLGASIATFCSSVSEVTEGDVAKITAIGSATGALVSVASSLEGYDDSTWFNTNLTEFAGEMVSFAGKIKEYATAVEGIDLSNSAAITNRATAFLSLAKSVQASEGASGSLSAFADSLVYFGMDLETFYGYISEIDTSKFASLATGLSSLAGININNADTIQSFINSLGEVSVDGVNKFISSISDAAPRVLSATGKLMLSAIKGITSKKKLFAANFKGALNDAVDAVEGYYSNFSTAGGYLVEGFAAGITTNTFQAEAAAAAMAEAAKLAAEEALGIASPAKEMIEDGMFTTEGFAKGILKGISRVYDAGRRTAAYAKQGFSDAISRVSDLIANGIDSEPTIRPVLDLSDISAGADRINGMLSMNPSVGAMSNVTAISAMMSRRQNGPNSDVVSAIKDLGNRIGNMSGTVNNNYVNGISYNDDSAVADAIGVLINAAIVEGRA